MRNNCGYTNHDGYTLLEVLIATAVLVVGLGSVMQLATLSLNQAQRAAELSLAEIACQTRLALLLASGEKITSRSWEPLPELPSWSLAVIVTSTNHQGIFSVTVTARQHSTTRKQTSITTRFAPHFTLVQFVHESRVE